ncbi:hypothetical protein BJV77DRAFT_652526 [Russula vinacea]|nr:hypothetical protein BJV77DRAFT_652526 [Russula vinacea]
MTIMIASNNVEHFVRTLRIRGLTNRIKLNGIPLQRATVRTSVNISPTRLEFEGGQSVASYQSKVKVVEEGVLQASDPGDDIVPDLEVCIDKLQDEQPLLVKECTCSGPASVTTHGTTVHHDGGCHHVSSASSHQLSSVLEVSPKRPTTPSLAPGPPPPPLGTDPPTLHSPRAFSAPDRCHNGNNVATVNSSPSGHSHHDALSDKVLSDAIFGASDEELSSISDTGSIFCSVQPSSRTVKSRRVIRGSDSSKHCSRSQRRRRPHLSSRLTSPTSDLNPAQDPAPEQKLAPMVKRLRVIDSQDSTRDKLSDRGAAAATKRKKI